MTRHIAKIFCICVLASASSSGLGAQQARPSLEAGVWSGDLTPMHHPDARTPLQLAVSESAGSPSIEIHGPDGLVLPTHDVSVSTAGVLFSFFEPEADVPLRCDLRFDEDGGLDGRCSDKDGKWATLRMHRPSGGGGQDEEFPIDWMT